ncbi:hypothetical protein Tco_1404641 [Tanacetum coccineum]
MPQDSPLPRVNTLRSDESSMKLQELMVLCTTLSNKVKSLETDLKQTKKMYGAAYTKLIRKKADLEESSKQGRKIAEIDQDLDISLVQHDAKIQGRHGHDIELDFDFNAAKEVSTTKEDVSTAEPVSTAGAAVTTTSVVAAKDKGKAKMDESKTVQTKTKFQQEQERLGYEAAMRLQAELDKEERQMIARVEEREKYTEAEQARMLVELISQRKRYFAQQRAERRNKPPT